MQQRQPRLGDILDDYCPRERRVTNHVVVAMVGDQVKQTRCSTCEADHEYKHAAVPRQRRKPEQPGLYSQVLAAATPKRVVPANEPESVTRTADPPPEPEYVPPPPSEPARGTSAFEALFDLRADDEPNGNSAEPIEEGPAHRRLIRAQLPRHEGQVSTSRQAPDFTIRQPATRPKRFGARNQRGAQFQNNRSGGIGNSNGNRGGTQRPGGRPQGGRGNRPGGGRNRPK